MNYNYCMPVTQLQLIKCINSILGNNFLSHEGFCFGLSSMAIAAMLLGDDQIEVFIQRLKFTINEILNHKENILTQKIENLTQEQKQQRTDILAFWEAVKLFQNTKNIDNSLFPANTPNISSQSKMQPIIFSMVKSLAFKPQEHIQLVYSACGCYRYQGLISLLEKLNDAITNYHNQHKLPFAIMLLNHNHAISLYYNPTTTKWTLIDANHLDEADEKLHSGSIVPTRLFSAFGLDRESASWGISSNTIALGIRIFSLGSNNIQTNCKTQFEFISNDTLLGLENWKQQDVTKNMKYPVNSTIDGGNLLFMAALLGDDKVVKKILENKILIKDNGRLKGITPLMAAVLNGYCSTVEILLQHGVNIEESTYSFSIIKGESPLIVAIKTGNLAMVDLLLKYGASVTSKGYQIMSFFGQTPLFVAASHNHVNIIKKLLEYRADLNEKSNDVTPLSISAQSGCREATAELLRAGERITIDKKDLKSIKTLYEALVIKDDVTGENILQTLQEKHADNLEQIINLIKGCNNQDLISYCNKLFDQAKEDVFKDAIDEQYSFYSAISDYEEESQRKRPGKTT